MFVVEESDSSGRRCAGLWGDAGTLSSNRWSVAERDRKHCNKKV